MPPEFQCPSDPNPAKDLTSYVMLVGPNAASAGPKGRKLSEFTNGTSNTIIVAETTGGQINWMEPRDLDVETMAFDLNDDTGNEMSSCHPGAVNALYGDGSVRSLSKSTDPNAVKSMTAVTGGAQPQPPQNWQPEEDF
jgi:prepilin-type processing-associated H-X9-DG protein